MNRGVMVTRGTPDIKKLEFSAAGICGEGDNDQIKNKLKPYFRPLAQAYKVICDKQKREFFGLRDFYRFAHHFFNYAFNFDLDLQLNQNVVLDV